MHPRTPVSRAALAAPIAAVLALCACGASDDGETAGSGDSGGVTSGASSSSSASPESSDSGAAGCAAACLATEYCDWQFNGCGMDDFDAFGLCTPIPAGCSSGDDPVCACDGAVYGNACEAAAAGADVNTNSQCDAPPGVFACGFKFCDPTQSYCTVTDSLGSRDFACVALPEACADAPSCACLPEEPCGGCEPTPDGGLSVVCPGA